MTIEAHDINVTQNLDEGHEQQLEKRCQIRNGEEEVLHTRTAELATGHGRPLAQIIRHEGRFRHPGSAEGN